MNSGEVSLLVLADYSKAFDTVRFQTVINKMYSMGFSKTFLSWLIEYLSTRRQFVQIDDKGSDMESVAFDVPQGSILGPVIFNLYVSDLQSYVQCNLSVTNMPMTLHCTSTPK